MKNLLLLSVATIFSTVIFAQTNTSALVAVNTPLKTEKTDIKRAEKGVKKDGIKHPRHHACHKIGKKRH